MEVLMLENFPGPKFIRTLSIISKVTVFFSKNLNKRTANLSKFFLLFS